MKWSLLLAAICQCALAQQSAAKPPQACPDEKEELARAYGEASKSPLEVLHVIQKHLARCPDSIYRPELESRALSAAVELHENALVVQYGELVLARQPSDVPTLTEVTRALLASGSREDAGRALLDARRAGELLQQAQKAGNPGNISPTEWRNQTDRALAGAMTDESRASLILERPTEALTAAKRGFEIYPNADSARQLALSFERLGKPLEAALALADAFTVDDPQATAGGRAKDRARLGELYRQAKGSDADLGTLVLQAYDRNRAWFAAREARIHGNEPNFGLNAPMEFTLSAVDGTKLEMAGLKGKVLVLDFWATWCEPCRKQHPLYEQAKERFRDNPSVVFLSIDADSDRAPVKPFLADLKWQGPVYYEDGLARVFEIDELPVTIVLDRRGRIYTRKNGYVEQTFVDLLTERIRDALGIPAN